ncbi:WRKY transcription factor WRKY24 [Tanacetum coccineum]
MYPNCSMNKKLETNLDGQYTEIVYKGSHNHPKPQSTQRSSSSTSSLGWNNLQMSTQVLSNYEVHDYPDQSYGSQGSVSFNSVATLENSSVSVGDNEFDRSRSRSGGDDLDANEDEPQAKRWKALENEGISMIGGTRTVRELRVMVQTISDIDILDDGYRWRKYGHQVGQANSYSQVKGCQPEPKGNNAPTMAVRPMAISHYQANNPMVDPVRGSRTSSVSVNHDSEREFSETKEEPRDDMFLESLLF